MKEGDTVLVEGKVTMVGEEWLQIQVKGIQGVEYVRAPLAMVHPMPAEPKAARKPKVG